LAPNQIITHVMLPATDLSSATYEVRHGEGPDYPLTAAAAALKIEGGVVRSARIVLGHVAPTPWLSGEAAGALVGRTVDEQSAGDAGDAAVASATPLSNNGYKVQLARTAVKRAVLLAAGLETGGF
jgi:xanthine dehydrogenase YagS FAD-binding subunit